MQAHYYEDETAATGTCAVCIVRGERSVSAYVPFELSFSNMLIHFIDPFSP